MPLSVPVFDSIFGTRIDHGVIDNVGGAPSATFSANNKAAGIGRYFVIVVSYETSSAGVAPKLASITESSSTLSFSQLAFVTNATSGAHSETIEVWVASPNDGSTVFNSGGSNLTWTLTWDTTGTSQIDDWCITLFALYDPDILAPSIDPDGSLPAHAYNGSSTTPPSVTFNTIGNNDLLLGIAARPNGFNGGVAPSGWTNRDDLGTAYGQYLTLDYKFVASPQSSASYQNASATSDYWASMVLALSGGNQSTPTFDDTFGDVIDAGRTTFSQNYYQFSNSAKTGHDTEKIIMLVAYQPTASGQAITSITESSSTLSFTKLGKVDNGNSGSNGEVIEIWAATITSAFNPGGSSITYTINISNCVGHSQVPACVMMQAYEGVYFSTVTTDLDVTLPATATNSTSTTPPTVTFDTSNANDLLIAISAHSNGSTSFGTPPSGWTNRSQVTSVGGINSQGHGVDYKSVSSAQSGASYTFASSTNDVAWSTILLAFCCISNTPRGFLRARDAQDTASLSLRVKQQFVVLTTEAQDTSDIEVHVFPPPPRRIFFVS